MWVKEKQSSHASHIIRGLRYPQLILERLFLISNDIKTLHVLASYCLPQQIFNFPSNLLTRLMKKASNSRQVSKPAGNTRKTANKLNDRSFWWSKHHLIYHVASSIIFEICPMAIIVHVLCDKQCWYVEMLSVCLNNREIRDQIYW